MFLKSILVKQKCTVNKETFSIKKLVASKVKMVMQSHCMENSKSLGDLDIQGRNQLFNREGLEDLQLLKGK
jgi:hypothetical protein